MGVKGLVPLEGILVSNLHVKADWNCSLKMFALSKGSVPVFKIPFPLSVLIPNASLLRDLTNDQNFFAFSFFLGDDEASDRTISPW